MYCFTHTALENPLFPAHTGPAGGEGGGGGGVVVEGGEVVVGTGAIYATKLR